MLAIDIMKNGSTLLRTSTRRAGCGKRFSSHGLVGLLLEGLGAEVRHRMMKRGMKDGE